MAIIFRYVHIPREDGTLRRAPFIPIYTRNRLGKLIKVIALVDSGADDTVIPLNMAKILGLRQQEAEGETKGIGGKVKIKKTKFHFRIKGERESYPLEVDALVLQDEKMDTPLLLGRNGFFENFHITFRQDEEKIVLKKINPVKVY